MNYIGKDKKISFKFIDLFAGIGGFHIALKNLGGECVFASDINEECQKTYQINFDILPSGDITKVNLADIPKCDILCAGFPCQPFSISGKQKGFEDTRGNLFFNIIEIASTKDIPILFLENVKHLVHHDGGNTFKVIIRTLQESGYRVAWKVLNAMNFGLAQNRERLIIIASKRGLFNFNLIKQQNQTKIKDILDTDGDFEYLDKSEYTILNKKYWKKQISGLIFCGYRNKKIRIAGVRPDTIHLSRVHKQPNRIYHIDGSHPTIPSQESSGRFWIYDGLQVRKLTINECFRLMGFPDNYQKVSKTAPLYNQVGNSVAIPMIQAVGVQIIRQFFHTKDHLKIAGNKQEITQKKLDLPLFENQLSLFGE
jgi:DNA (cytosine-5)-methyltransferase 1